jgi:membrane protease YdiL (CAAX protease family)
MKKSIQFIILVFAVSWAAAGVAYLCGLRQAAGFAYTAFGMIYMLLPAVCAIILQKIHKEPLFKNLDISLRLNWWFLAALFTPIIISFAALGISLLLPNVSFSVTYEGLLSQMPPETAVLVEKQLSIIPPVAFLLIQIVSAIFAGCTINAFFALGEELGWRGYMLKSLKNKHFLTASLIIGTVWGLWHFPLILMGLNYPQHPIVGVAMMVICCILLTPIMIYIVVKSKSVITAAIFHGTLNAIAGICILYLVGGNDLTTGVTGIAGFIVIVLINIVLYLFDKFITKENIFSSILEKKSV